MALKKAFIITNSHGKMLGRDAWYLTPVCFSPEGRQPMTFATEAEALDYIAQHPTVGRCKVRPLI